MNTRSLSSLGEEQLALAKGASSGRSAVTIFGGQEHDMRQTLIALSGGSQLHEHESPRGGDPPGALRRRAAGRR